VVSTRTRSVRMVDSTSLADAVAGRGCRSPAAAEAFAEQATNANETTRNPMSIFLRVRALMSVRQNDQMRKRLVSPRVKRAALYRGGGDLARA
jgi:hypothetical protein